MDLYPLGFKNIVLDGSKQKLEGQSIIFIILDGDRQTI
jgi:hypothetical protein